MQKKFGSGFRKHFQGNQLQFIRIAHRNAPADGISIERGRPAAPPKPTMEFESNSAGDQNSFPRMKSKVRAHCSGIAADESAAFHQNCPRSVPGRGHRGGNAGGAAADHRNVTIETPDNRQRKQIHFSTISPFSSISFPPFSNRLRWGSRWRRIAC